MAATDQTPDPNKALALQEPSIHGPRTMASGISLDETTVGRELKGLGFSKISARPRHYAQNEFAIEAFKKNSPPNWRRSERASRPGRR